MLSLSDLNFQDMKNSFIQADVGAVKIVFAFELVPVLLDLVLLFQLFPLDGSKITNNFVLIDLFIVSLASSKQTTKFWVFNHTFRHRFHFAGITQ